MPGKLRKRLKGRLAARPTRNEMLTRVHNRKRVTLKTSDCAALSHARGRRVTLNDDSL
jgi:hypothetical protein